MKKLIALAAAISVGIGFIPATANASPYLSMAAAKAKANNVAYRVAFSGEGVNGAVDAYASGCYRLSSSSVQCKYTIEIDDDYTDYCQGTVRIRKTYSGYLSFTFPSKPHCY